MLHWLAAVAVGPAPEQPRKRSFGYRQYPGHERNYFGFWQCGYRGAEVAIEKLNAKGGINGKKIKLITLDTKGDPKEAINAYNRLVDQEKAIAVLGPPISNIGLALAPIANSKKVPIVGSFIDPRVTVAPDGKPQTAMFLMQPSSVQ